MKKSSYLYLAIILAMIIIIPQVTLAEESTSTAKPPMTSLEKLRASNQNIQKNENDRNRMLSNLKAASGTPEERRAIAEEQRKEAKDIRTQGREDMKNATSSGERKEIRRDMRKEEFMIRKATLVRQLGIALNNLKQIRERISARINKVSAEGRNMTEAKRLLVIADGKITIAGQAITALAAINPTASSTVTASSTIDLTKPRQAGDAAIKALKDAHKALVDVVVAIAQNMGRGNATSTPPTGRPPKTSTTTNPVATTTNPTATTTNPVATTTDPTASTTNTQGTNNDTNNN